MNALEDIVYPVVEVMQGQQNTLRKDPNTVLFGMDAALDSLALMTFMAAVEQQTQMVTGKTVQIVTPDLFLQPRNPLETLGSLAAYIDHQTENIQISACT